MKVFQSRLIGGPWRAAAALTLLVTAAGAGQATAQQVRLGHMLPASHPFQAGAQEAANLLKERSNGRIDLRVFPASQLGDEKAQTEQVMIGSLQIFFGTYGMLGNWVPAMSVFEAPYAFRDLPHYRKVVESEIFAKANEAMVKATGARVIDSWYLGNRQVVTRDTPVNSPADLNGKKLRVPEAPIYIELAKAMGGTPTPFAYSEVYLGLRQGALDAAENPVSGIWTHKWHEIAKHLAITNHMLQNLAVVVNEKFYQGLSPADRELLTKTLVEVGRKVSQSVLDNEASLVGKLEAAGVKVTRPDIAVFQKRAAEMLPKVFAAKWGEGVYERIQAMAD